MCTCVVQAYSEQRPSFGLSVHRKSAKQKEGSCDDDAENYTLLNN